MAGKSEMFSAVFPANLAASVTRELLSRSTSMGRARALTPFAISILLAGSLACIVAVTAWLVGRSAPWQ